MPIPFESGRSIASQLTARRMNDLQRDIQPVKFSATGARVSRMGGQTFVRIPRTRNSPKASNPGALQPGSDVSTNSDPMYTITAGQYGLVTPTIGGVNLSAATALNIITFGPTDTYAYVASAFSYDTTTGIISGVTSPILTGSGALPGMTISGGTGVVYEILINVAITAPVGSGPYTVIGSPGVGGSKNYNVCLAGPSISGPFRA